MKEETREQRLEREHQEYLLELETDEEISEEMREKLLKAEIEAHGLALQGR